MNVKVLLIFCDTSVTVQPSLTFADAPSEGPVPTQKRTKGKITAHSSRFFNKTNTSTGPVPRVYNPFSGNEADGTDSDFQMQAK